MDPSAVPKPPEPRNTPRTISPGATIDMAHFNPSYVPARHDRGNENALINGNTPPLPSLEHLGREDFDSALLPRPSESTEAYNGRLPKRFLKFRSWVVGRQVEKAEGGIGVLERDAAAMWHAADSASRIQSSAYKTGGANRSKWGYGDSAVTRSDWYAGKIDEARARAETMVPEIPEIPEIPDTVTDPDERRMQEAFRQFDLTARKDRVRERTQKVEALAKSMAPSLEPRRGKFAKQRRDKRELLRTDRSRAHTGREAARLNNFYRPMHESGMELDAWADHNQKRGIAFAEEEAHHSHEAEHKLVELATAPAKKVAETRSQISQLRAQQAALEAGKVAKQERKEERREVRAERRETRRDARAERRENRRNRRNPPTPPRSTPPSPRTRTPLAEPVRLRGPDGHTFEVRSV